MQAANLSLEFFPKNVCFYLFYDIKKIKCREIKDETEKQVLANAKAKISIVDVATVDAISRPFHRSERDERMNNIEKRHIQKKIRLLQCACGPTLKNNISISSLCRRLLTANSILVYKPSRSNKTTTRTRARAILRTADWLSRSETRGDATIRRRGERRRLKRRRRTHANCKATRRNSSRRLP